jgi:hypothetical protein
MTDEKKKAILKYNFAKQTVHPRFLSRYVVNKVTLLEKIVIVWRLVLLKAKVAFRYDS